MSIIQLSTCECHTAAVALPQLRRRTCGASAVAEPVAEPVQLRSQFSEPQLRSQFSEPVLNFQSSGRALVNLVVGRCRVD